MLSYFPVGYKDETIYSMLMRYARAYGYTKNMLLNEFKRENEKFVCMDTLLGIQLDRLFENLPWMYSNSIQDMINDHTIIPSYKAFLEEDEYKKLEGYIISDIRQAIRNLPRNWNKEIKYCEICMKEDKKKYGEAYLHRTHQLKGILFCPEHECNLRAVKENAYLIDINSDINLFMSYDVAIQYKESDKYIALQIAKEFKYLLDNYKSIGSYSNTQDRYFEAFYEDNQYIFQNRVGRTQIYEKIFSIYSIPFLRDIFWGKRTRDEVINMSYKRLRVKNPIEHIFLMLALFGKLLKLEKHSEKKVEENKKDKIFKIIKDRNRQLILDKLGQNVGMSRNAFKESKNEGVAAAYAWLYDHDKEWIDKQFIQKKENDKELCEKHKRIVVEGITKISNVSRKRVRDKYSGSYDWLRKNAPHILDELLPTKNKSKEELFTIHSEKILKFIQDNPDATRSLIKKNHIGSYIWLKNNTREWFETNLPASKRGY